MRLPSSSTFGMREVRTLRGLPSRGRDDEATVLHGDVGDRLPGETSATDSMKSLLAGHHAERHRLSRVVGRLQRREQPAISALLDPGDHRLHVLDTLPEDRDRLAAPLRDLVAILVVHAALSTDHLVFGDDLHDLVPLHIVTRVPTRAAKPAG